MAADVFNIGVSALLASQRQLSSASHNISNVNTEGYSRQRVELMSRPPQAVIGGYAGKGVQISAIRRSADEFLTTQLRASTSNEARAGAYVDFANQIDTLLGDGTFSRALEDFFAAVQDANNDPGSIPARLVLLSTAESLTNRFSADEGRLTISADDVNEQIKTAVGRINALSDSIASMNQDIVRALGRAQDAPPNDLLDHRDQLLLELSEIVGVSTVEQSDGALNVFVGNGQLLVAGSISVALTTVQNPLDASRLEVGADVGGTISVISDTISNGALGAALDFRDDMLDPARNALGRLAAALALSYNAQHREGMDLAGLLGGDLFSLGTPQVNSNPANAGTVSVALDPGAVGQLTAADYRLTHDGVNFTLTNLTDLSQQVLAGPGPFNVDGLVITVGTPPAAGDEYLLLPTRTLARNMDVVVSRAEDIALASPIRSLEALANIGDAAVIAPQVLDITDPGLLITTQIVFADPPNAFQINGVGPLIPYTSGADIDVNGWRVQISGNPEPGDVFTVAANVGGEGDNTNGLLLADLQLTRIIDNATATFQDAFGEILAAVGADTQQMQISFAALRSLRENALAARDEVAGVNLDEEAANLLRFQQAYEAAAQMIVIANETFDSLLSALRR